VLKVLGDDAFCIDDESVYDSLSIIALGKVAVRLNMYMTFCSFKLNSHWKDGGIRNWITALGPKQPIYPVLYGPRIVQHL